MQKMRQEDYLFILEKCFTWGKSKCTFTWDAKGTQTGLKSQTALRFRSAYMAIYMEISLRRLAKR